MDPYVQAAGLALLGGLGLIVTFFLVVPNFPPDPPRKEPPPEAAE